MENNTELIFDESTQQRQSEILACEIRKNDIEYKKLFERLKECSDILDEITIDKKKKMETMAEIEFVFTKLRMSITNEMVNIKSIISDKDFLSNKSLLQYVAMFKTRETTLNTYNLRLNEIREDMNVFQKFMWMYQGMPRNFE